MTRDDDQTIATLRSAMATQVRGHHLDPDLAAPAIDRLESQSRHPRRRTREFAAVAACLVGAVAVAVGYAVTRGDAGPQRATPPAGSSCAGAVVTTALPVWARAGFSPGATVVPHVLGAEGNILGVLFGQPLHSPPAKDHNNKILWVAKDRGNGPLVISAKLDGTDRTATRRVPDGPGPSIIDLPAAGCWHLTLTWAGQRDTMSVPYAP